MGGVVAAEGRRRGDNSAKLGLGVAGRRVGGDLFAQALDVSHADGSNEPSNSPDSDTEPVDRPRSHSVMVLMSTRAMRPAPLWVTASLAGVEDPVRMNRPRSPPAASTARRVASQVEGTSCHSSTT